MKHAPPIPPEATAAARRLCGSPLLDVSAVGGGRNSRVFAVTATSGRYALKAYPDDGRARVEREIGALRFLREAAPEAPVPQPLAWDADSGFALLEWIDGEPVRDHGLREVDEAANLLRLLHGLRDRPAARALPEAAEACLSRAEVERQIVARRALLGELDEPELRHFLRSDFDPALDLIRRHAAADDPEPEAVLEAARRTLSPSDFGFHNALRNPGGLVFLDFEYFGWDDPVKASADFVLHPGMQLSKAQKAHFHRATTEIYDVDPLFEARRHARFPLFALRWALIVLNEFVPVVWRRRLAAGADSDWSAAKAAQLLKARATLVTAHDR